MGGVSGVLQWVEVNGVLVWVAWLVSLCVWRARVGSVIAWVVC